MNRYEVVHQMAMQVATIYVENECKNNPNATKEAITSKFKAAYIHAVSDFKSISDNKLSFGS